MNKIAQASEFCNKEPGEFPEIEEMSEQHRE